MQLWIRNQDKTGNYKSTSQVIRRIGHEDKSEKFVILNNNKMNELLGTYKTKERALEVLDEIQEFMTFDEEHYEGRNKVAYQQCNIYKSNLLMIYEMPK